MYCSCFGGQFPRKASSTALTLLLQTPPAPTQVSYKPKDTLESAFTELKTATMWAHCGGRAIKWGLSSYSQSVAVTKTKRLTRSTPARASHCTSYLTGPGLLHLLRTALRECTLALLMHMVVSWPSTRALLIPAPYLLNPRLFVLQPTASIAWHAVTLYAGGWP